MQPWQLHCPWPCGLHVDSSWEQVKLPEGSKDLYFEMEQELWTLVFVLALLRTAGLFPWQKEELVFETGVHHSPRLHGT